jgi:hypothetical protein
MKMAWIHMEPTFNGLNGSPWILHNLVMQATAVVDAHVAASLDTYGMSL